MKKTLISISSCAILLGISSVAYAADNTTSSTPTNFYAGVNAGMAVAGDACDNTGYVGNGITVLSCEDSDLGFKVYGGYQFNEYLGAEAYYVNFGEATADLIASTYYGPVGADVAFEASGFGAVVTVALPVSDKFSLFGKAGVLAWNAEVTANVSYISVTEEDDGLSFIGGIGAQYLFTDMVGVRLEWDRSTVGDDDTTGESDVDLFSAGLVIHF